MALQIYFKHEVRLRGTLSVWRTNYHLTEAQERLIRSEEERLHGGAVRFDRPQHTPEETVAHEVTISYLMNPQEGERLLAGQRLLEGQSANSPHTMTFEDALPPGQTP